MNCRSWARALLIAAAFVMPSAASAATSAAFWYERSDYAHAHPYIAVTGLQLPNAGGIVALFAYSSTHAATPRTSLATLFIVGTGLTGEHEATVRFRLDRTRPTVVALLSASTREVEVAVSGYSGQPPKMIGPLTVADTP